MATMTARPKMVVRGMFLRGFSTPCNRRDEIVSLGGDEGDGIRKDLAHVSAPLPLFGIGLAISGGSNYGLVKAADHTGEQRVE